MLIASCGLAKAQSIEIPKGATQIFIKNDKNGNENYKSVLKFLVNNDYAIDKRDEELGTISTEQIPVTKYGLVIKLNILCGDNSIRISGNFKTGITMSFGGVTSTDEWDYIRNKGMGGSMIRAAFEKMNEIASKYGGEISYK